MPSPESSTSTRRALRRPIALAAAVAAVLAVPAAVEAHLDHPVPTVTGTAPGLSTAFNSGGDDAEWDLIATLPTFNPHSDLDFFTQKGKTYMSVGVLGIAANGGGQDIIQLADEKGAVAPRFVSNHPSASCVSDPSAALGLQHDVEATPKGEAILNTEFPNARRTDAQLLVDATDAPGRCHDQGNAGISSAPRGGLELIDITDITKPKEIGLTSHIGQSHTVNVDPKRPHIAYSVTSDAVGVDAQGKRANETGTGRSLDGWEVVDMRSCLEAPLGTIPAGATIAQKRELCKPQVYRYRYPSIDIALGHTNQNQIYGCHELELYPDDKLTCGGGAAMMVFDVSGAFDDNGTPADFTDDKPRGTPLPCAVRDTSTTATPFKTGAKVTDCVVGANGTDLGISGWMKIGSPSLEGVKHLGSAFHMGRESATGAVQPKYPSTEDIDFDHEAEFSHSRKFVLATDERGGGVLGGAQCSPGADIPFANGGLHAYAVDRLQQSTPTGTDAAKRAEAAFEAYARTPKGKKAIFRAPIHTQPEPSFCTAHVFQQIPGQNRIFMGWYTQGTQVVDFQENPDGTFEFKQAGYFIPENANQWVSHIFKVERTADGRFTYYGATGDGIVGDAGRNGVDVYKVTLPAPPAPLGSKAPDGPSQSNDGVVGNGASTTQPAQAVAPSGEASACKATGGFRAASVSRSGRGLRFAFTTEGDRDVSVDVFRVARGRDARGNRLVARFANRGDAFRWNGRTRRGVPAPNGVYFARMRVDAGGGRVAVRRFALLRSRGRFSVVSGTFHRPDTCGLVTTAKLSSPAFGGRRSRPLGIAFRVGQSARVTVTVSRGSKVVKRYAARTYDPGRTVRLSLKAKGLKRGVYTVRIAAARGSRQATVALVSRRL